MVIDCVELCVNSKRGWNEQNQYAENARLQDVPDDTALSGFGVPIRLFPAAWVGLRIL